MFTNQFFDKMRQRFSDGAHNHQGLLSQGQKDLWRTHGTNRLDHRRSDFTHHGIAQQDGNGADYGIHPLNTSTDRIFSRRTPVGAGFHHLGGGNGIGAECPYFNPLVKGFPDSPDDCRADAATLTINDRYLDQENILSTSSSLNRFQVILDELTGCQDTPNPEELMIAQDILLTISRLHLEVSERYAPGIQGAFVPSVKDARNPEMLIAPFKTVRFLPFPILIPSKNSDALEFHTMKQALCSEPSQSLCTMHDPELQVFKFKNYNDIRLQRATFFDKLDTGSGNNLLRYPGTRTESFQ